MRLSLQSQLIVRGCLNITGAGIEFLDPVNSSQIDVENPSFTVRSLYLKEMIEIRLQIRPASPEDKILRHQHIAQHTYPKRNFVVVQMIHTEIVKEDMVQPECNRGHGHAITPDHPVLMRQYIFLFDRL